jgi:serine/threonine protein kinase
MARLQPGQTWGRYVVDRLVAVGGTSDVYQARDVEQDRTVALKILRTEVVGGGEGRRRFR